MRLPKRPQQLLRQPSYRTKLVFFFTLSGLIFMVYILITKLTTPPPPWSDILLEFAVTFGAVGVLQVVWDLLGGEPMELRIDGLEEEVKDLQSSLGVLVNLTDSEVGLERIWADRRSWQSDEPDGLKAWQKRVCRAKEVDIVSNTLKSNWMQESFLEELFRGIDDGTRVRILIYDPKSDVLELRADLEGDEVNEMKGEIIGTLSRLEKHWGALSDDKRQNLQVRLTHKALHSAQIIRTADRILVATYLAEKGGSSSPTMQIRGEESKLYKTYKKQFEFLWGRARKLENNRKLKRMLDRLRKDSARPDKD